MRIFNISCLIHKFLSVNNVVCECSHQEKQKKNILKSNDDDDYSSIGLEIIHINTLAIHLFDSTHTFISIVQVEKLCQYWIEICVRSSIIQ